MQLRIWNKWIFQINLDKSNFVFLFPNPIGVMQTSILPGGGGWVIWSHRNEFWMNVCYVASPLPVERGTQFLMSNSYALLVGQDEITLHLQPLESANKILCRLMLVLFYFGHVTDKHFELNPIELLIGISLHLSPSAWI